MAFYIVAAFVAGILALPIKLAVEININRAPGIRLIFSIGEHSVDFDGSLKRAQGEYVLDFGRAKSARRHSKALSTMRSQAEQMQLLFPAGKAALGTLMNNVKTEHLLMHMRIGTGDASETAILSGVAGILAAALCAVADVRPDIEVRPDFGNKTFVLRFEGMFSMRLGHIIGAGITGLAEYCKGAFGKWKTRLKAAR